MQQSYRIRTAADSIVLYNSQFADRIAIALPSRPVPYARARGKGSRNHI